jgi:hypothetical protein
MVDPASGGAGMPESAPSIQMSSTIIAADMVNEVGLSDIVAADGSDDRRRLRTDHYRYWHPVYQRRMRQFG